MSAPLVLSLFPGIGLLDMAFEEEGFCVVRGPDLLWGGDVRRFHPPAGRFDGVIGGPPCQLFGGLANFAHRWKRQPEDLIPEFARIVRLARPKWFLMENVPGAPRPECDNYERDSVLINNRDFGAPQDRLRRFTFGLRGGLLYGNRSAARSNPTRKNPWIYLGRFTAPASDEYARTLTAAHAGHRQRMKGPIEPVTVERALELQGLPPDFFQLDSPLTAQGKKKLLAQGVPMPMGRAVVKAVRMAMYPESIEAIA